MFHATEINAIQVAIEQLETAIVHLSLVQRQHGVLSTLAESVQQRLTAEVAVLNAGLHDPEQKGMLHTLADTLKMTDHDDTVEGN